MKISRKCAKCGQEHVIEFEVKKKIRLAMRKAEGQLDESIKNCECQKK